MSIIVDDTKDINGPQQFRKIDDSKMVALLRNVRVTITVEGLGEVSMQLGEEQMARDLDMLEHTGLLDALRPQVDLLLTQCAMGIASQLKPGEKSGRPRMEDLDPAKIDLANRYYRGRKKTGMTVEDICKELGIGRTTLYRYVGKDDKS